MDLIQITIYYVLKIQKALIYNVLGVKKTFALFL